MTPLKAIRLKCLDCTCDQPGEVRACPSESCALWPYRMGHNPARKGMGGKFIIEGENDVVEVEDDEDGLINQHQLPHNVSQG